MNAALKPVTTLRPGTILQDTYRIEHLMGSGATGEVYLAAHARLPGWFAVKVLHRDLVSDREAFSRFCREADMMSQVRHPNVVQVLDFNATPDGTPYLIMEHVEGTDLETRLRERGPLPLPEALSLVRQIACALQAAHDLGIVHRDLKPANVMVIPIVGQPDFVKVMDFGISRAAGSSHITKQSRVVGTPAYMSPEQALGQTENVDGRSDQFALAAVAFEMFTGREAFTGHDALAIIRNVVTRSPPLLGKFVTWPAVAVDKVLRRAMAKDRNARFPSILEFSRALDEAAAEPEYAELSVTIDETIETLPEASTAAIAPDRGRTRHLRATTDVDAEVDINMDWDGRRPRSVAWLLLACIALAGVIGGTGGWRHHLAEASFAGREVVAAGRAAMGEPEGSPSAAE